MYKSISECIGVCMCTQAGRKIAGGVKAAKGKEGSTALRTSSQPEHLLILVFQLSYKTVIGAFHVYL